MKNDTPPAGETFGIADAAAFMRLGQDALRALIVTGQIPALSLNSKHVVLLREDLIEFVKKGASEQQLDRRSRWLPERRVRLETEDKRSEPRKPGRPRRPLPTLMTDEEFAASLRVKPKVRFP